MSTLSEEVLDSHLDTRNWFAPTSNQCPLIPQKQTFVRALGTSALCQRQTFRPLLDIIVGGQGCSSSWTITRETSPLQILTSSRCAQRVKSRRSGLVSGQRRRYGTRI